tara:strand:+ start:118 stop:771 length:654 start_codon:yes stop_codon:yes gene_type:complete
MRTHPLLIPALALTLLVGCASGPSPQEEQRAAAQEQERRQAVREVWDESVRDAKEGESASSEQAEVPRDRFQEWIELRMAAGKALLKSKEALMAWRHAVTALQNGPRPAMESSHEREQRLRRAIDRRQSLMNFVREAMRDLDRIEAGDLSLIPNQPGGFPVEVSPWTTGRTLADGRYEIAEPKARDPDFEDDLSLAAEARGEEAQAAAIAERDAAGK